MKARKLMLIVFGLPAWLLMFCIGWSLMWIGREQERKESKKK